MKKPKENLNQAPQIIDPKEASSVVTPSRCPLCQKENACNGEDIANCWCNDTSITFPQSILDQVPESSKGLACICFECAIKHQNKT